MWAIVVYESYDRYNMIRTSDDKNYNSLISEMPKNKMRLVFSIRDLNEEKLEEETERMRFAIRRLNEEENKEARKNLEYMLMRRNQKIP